jgi:hypothetical protein
MEWFVTIQYHTLVSVSLALVVVGIVKLEEGTITDGTKAVLKVGIALVILSWLLLNIWTMVSWKSRKVVRTSPGYNDGTKARLLSSFECKLANEICSCWLLLQLSCRLLWYASSMPLSASSSTLTVPRRASRSLVQRRS